MFVKKHIMKPFTKETIDTIIKIGGNGTLDHLKLKNQINKYYAV